MSRILVVAALLAALAAPARADWDAAGEAREAAKRKAEQQEAARRKAEADKQKAAAEAKVMRGSLGREAEGKSDAEVKRIYEAKLKGHLDQAKKAQSGAGWALTGAQRGEMAKGDGQMKAMTGKSMKEIEGMNEKELEAFARQMEKQYGGATK